jgi:signal transduction histidine kinase
MNQELINILLVEDNLEDAQLFQDLLDMTPENNLWNVVHVVRLSDALAELDRVGLQVILLDLSLPDSQGLDTLVSLREQAPQLPIIVLTGLQYEQLGITAVREGAQDYLMKGVVSGGMIARSILYAIERKKNEIAMRACLEQERELREIKSRFISMLSHELRNPLTTILASATLIENFHATLTPEKKLEMNRKIKTSADRMNKIVEDLLALWNQESIEQNQFKPVWFDLLEFCHRLIAEFQVQLDHQFFHQFNPIQLRFVNVTNCGQVYLDPNLLEQILSNLLSNAIKYSPQGGEVRLEVSQDSTWVIFRIQDCGMGIPWSDRDRLFTCFYRATNTQGIPGTGLGLSIVKKAVDLQGGSLDFTSEVCVGSTFTVTLPLNFSPGFQQP